MKSMIIAATLFMALNVNAASIECALYKNNNSNEFIAKTDTKFSDEGSISISEKDNILSNPEASRYAFSATVESGELIAIRLSDKTLGIATEHKTFQGNLMKITLESKGLITNFDCWMFN